MRLPLHHLGGIVVFGNVCVSLALMHRLADNGQCLMMLDGNGRFKALLEGPVSGNILLRQAQHAKAGEGPFGLGPACVAGKVLTCRQVLLRGVREAKADEDGAALSRGADDLAATLRALPDAADLDTLRGLKSEAPRQYLGCLNRLVRTAARQDFALESHPPPPGNGRPGSRLRQIHPELRAACLRHRRPAARRLPLLHFDHMGP